MSSLRRRLFLQCSLLGLLLFLTGVLAAEWGSRQTLDTPLVLRHARIQPACPQAQSWQSELEAAHHQRALQLLRLSATSQTPPWAQEYFELLVAQVQLLHNERRLVTPAQSLSWHLVTVPAGSADSLAVSTVSGLVAVSAELWDNYTPVEARAALAHEVAHVALNHANTLNCVMRPALSHLKALSSQGVDIDGLLGTARAHSRAWSHRQEFEADELAAWLLDVTGQPPQAMRYLLRALTSDCPHTGCIAGQTHPSLEERIQYLERASSKRLF